MKIIEKWLTGEFSVLVLVKKSKNSFSRGVSHCSVMPCEFGLVEWHWMVTVNVVHVFHHDLREFQGNRSCVGGPVEPSYLSWVPESWFWSTSSGFKKGNWSISISVTPFEIWKVVVTNDGSIKVSVAINTGNCLNFDVKGYNKNNVLTFEKASRKLL